MLVLSFNVELDSKVLVVEVGDVVGKGIVLLGNNVLYLLILFNALSWARWIEVSWFLSFLLSYLPWSQYLLQQLGY